MIKPENIRIYKQPNGVYTTQPKGKYISGLSECDGLTSVTVSIFPSWPEAKKEIESILQFALPASLPVYIPPQPPELSTKEFVPDLNRITVTVEDLTYLGLYVCTVSIIGFDSPDGGRDKICYEDFLPKMASPLHHQILSTLDDFCGHLREPNQVHDFSDSFGRFYTRFSWNGNGVEVGLANIRIYDEERRGHGFLTELIDHLKLDVRVKKIRVECVGSDKLKAYLRTNRFKEFSPNSNNFVLGGDEFEGLRR
ncbi:MAG TPA: hypothetical protein VIS99_12495 [Terrimicrobiaceae bacterium]